MALDPAAIGGRIKKARQGRWSSTQKLADALRELMLAKRDQRSQDDAKKGRATLTRQAVDNWEKGAVVPPWDQIGLLAELFGPPHDEEWILFGQRRDEQLSREKPRLVLCTPEEVELIQQFRRANPTGQASITASVTALASAHPAPLAELRTLRRDEPRNEH